MKSGNPNNSGATEDRNGERYMYNTAQARTGCSGLDLNGTPGPWAEGACVMVPGETS